MSESQFKTLPPVRKNVFKHSLSIVAVYVGVGIFMMIAVFLASGTTPKAIHVNYDSIAAAEQMREAWNALENPILFPEKTQIQWQEQFEQNLKFEETNITEPGEGELAQEARKLWTSAQTKLPPSVPEFQKLRTTLVKITAVNEKGMFAWVAKSHRFSRQVFLVTVCVFLLTILFALYLADALAVTIATPLRDLAAALKLRPEPGHPLIIPEAETLEMRILSQALTAFWAQISYFQTLNLEQITAQRKKLEAVLISMEDAVLVLDTDERIIHCNPGIELALGLQSDALLNKPWRDLSSASDNYLKLRDLLTPALKGDQTVEFEIAGKMKVFAGRHRQINDDQKKVIGNLYLLHDITDTKQRDFLREEFIGVLSHELKTPLQSLGTASELLMQERQKHSSDEQMLIETVFEDTNRIKSVVNEFIEVGISDVHSLRLKMDILPIQKLIYQWVQPIQVLAKEKQVKVEINFLVPETQLIQVDKTKFSWAIANLLSNALRLTPVGSVILVSVRVKPGFTLIDISDQGPGISKEAQERMFEPYFQGAQKNGVKSAGFLGIGLTITRDVVEAHGGTVSYAQNLPSGSIFTISLPDKVS